MYIPAADGGTSTDTVMVSPLDPYRQVVHKPVLENWYQLAMYWTSLHISFFLFLFCFVHLITELACAEWLNAVDQVCLTTSIAPGLHTVHRFLHCTVFMFGDSSLIHCPLSPQCLFLFSVLFVVLSKCFITCVFQVPKIALLFFFCSAKFILVFFMSALMFAILYLIRIQTDLSRIFFFRSLAAIIRW